MCCLMYIGGWFRCTYQELLSGMGQYSRFHFHRWTAEWCHDERRYIVR